MTMYRSPVGSNWGGYSNPEVDDLAQFLAAHAVGHHEQPSLIAALVLRRRQAGRHDGG